jgi:CRISPR-associated endonuclease Csn1
MGTKTVLPALHISLDVGHSSLGWAVFDHAHAPGDAHIQLLGCGAVIFRADDCLASVRRGFRRQRRHIRATRQRIRRLKVLLLHLGVLNQKQLDTPGCAWPWLLAARALNGGKPLTWPELWDVLRWYAHNRGYDGNRRWSAADAAADAEDTEKEENARRLMSEHKTTSMAETFCRVLGLDPKGAKRSSTKRFKGLNAAFPRDVVEGEVRRLLRIHSGKLKGVDEKFERALLGNDGRDRDAWKAIPCPELKLPLRYQGALLFGQLVPRFDNRIISTCPITGAKVPGRNCPEFLNFRWAMQLANIRVAGLGEEELRPLHKDERGKLDAAMRERGYLTPGELKQRVRDLTGCARDNLDLLLLHPDAKDALLVDPVQKLITSEEVAPWWATLPARLQKRLTGQWRRGKHFTLRQIREQAAALGDITSFDAVLDKVVDAHNTKTREKDTRLGREDLLKETFPARPLKLSGRAAYARPLLIQAYKEVMAGKGHPKEEGGCLFITEKIREQQLKKELDHQTNNHLVRHRLLILERLVKDIVKDYAGGDATQVGRVTIEVTRDLRELSGKTAKEKAQDMGLRLSNHHKVAEDLEQKLKGKTFNGKPVTISAGLIRKARIAEDLGWICPYTGQNYDAMDLVTRKVDKDHIIPRTLRPSDSLDSLVITFSEINKWKGKRTAFQFISEEQSKPVQNMKQLSVMTLARYKKLIEGLEDYKGHDDDKRRKKKRKELLLLPSYEEKEFVPRDLTQTSQLVRLGAQTVRRVLTHLQPHDVVSLPGSVTGAVRKGWRVLGCLSTAAPQVLDENGDVKTKSEIRDITHLHHALDACVLGLTAHFIPNNGRVWSLITKRSWTKAEEAELRALGIYGPGKEGRFELRDLDDRLKEQIRQRLAERRVVQHVPASMEGLRVEQNTWRVVGEENGEVILRQRIRQADGTRPLKERREKPQKLLGYSPDNTKSGAVAKLKRSKGVLVIPENFGIALGTEPTVIPFHKVWPRLSRLKDTNGGKLPKIVRNGKLITVARGKYQGVWRVFSAKATLTLDLGAPDKVRLESKGEGQKREVQLKTLLKDGMELADCGLTGLAACPTTSSALIARSAA